MKIFTIEKCPQGSPFWHDCRRGLPTASGLDRILTATGKPSAQADDYAAELAADVAHLSPTWFSENGTKPPNRAMQAGIDTEPEARRWFEYERECTVQMVGGCLTDDGRFWCSPDGLCVDAQGQLIAGVEIKAPMLKTQAKYVMAGTLPAEYRHQLHGSLIVTGLPLWHFLSYANGLPNLLLDVKPDAYTDKLRTALDDFWTRYMTVLDTLHLRKQFESQRQSILAHLVEAP